MFSSLLTPGVIKGARLAARTGFRGYSSHLIRQRHNAHWRPPQLVHGPRCIAYAIRNRVYAQGPNEAAIHTELCSIKSLGQKGQSREILSLVTASGSNFHSILTACVEDIHRQPPNEYIPGSKVPKGSPLRYIADALILEKSVILLDELIKKVLPDCVLVTAVGFSRIEAAIGIVQQAQQTENLTDYIQVFPNVILRSGEVINFQDSSHSDWLLSHQITDWITHSALGGAESHTAQQSMFALFGEYLDPARQRQGQRGVLQRSLLQLHALQAAHHQQQQQQQGRTASHTNGTVAPVGNYYAQQLLALRQGMGVVALAGLHSTISAHGLSENTWLYIRALKDTGLMEATDIPLGLFRQCVSHILSFNKFPPAPSTTAPNSFTRSKTSTQSDPQPETDGFYLSENGPNQPRSLAEEPHKILTELLMLADGNSSHAVTLRAAFLEQLVSHGHFLTALHFTKSLALLNEWIGADSYHLLLRADAATGFASTHTLMNGMVGEHSRALTLQKKIDSIRAKAQDPRRRLTASRPVTFVIDGQPIEPSYYRGSSSTTAGAGADADAGARRRGSDRSDSKARKVINFDKLVPPPGLAIGPSPDTLEVLLENIQALLLPLHNGGDRQGSRHYVPYASISSGSSSGGGSGGGDRRRKSTTSEQRRLSALARAALLQASELATAATSTDNSPTNNTKNNGKRVSVSKSKSGSNNSTPTSSSRSSSNSDSSVDICTRKAIQLAYDLAHRLHSSRYHVQPHPQLLIDLAHVALALEDPGLSLRVLDVAYRLAEVNPMDLDATESRDIKYVWQRSQEAVASASASSKGTNRSTPGEENPLYYHSNISSNQLKGYADAPGEDMDALVGTLRADRAATMGTTATMATAPQFFNAAEYADKARSHRSSTSLPHPHSYSQSMARGIADDTLPHPHSYSQSMARGIADDTLPHPHSYSQSMARSIADDSPVVGSGVGTGNLLGLVQSPSSPPPPSHEDMLQILEVVIRLHIIKNYNRTLGPVLATMLERGIKPTKRMVSASMKCFLNGRRYEEVVWLFESLPSHGVPRKLTHARLLAEALVMQNKLLDAWNAAKVIRHMQAQERSDAELARIARLQQQRNSSSHDPVRTNEDDSSDSEDENKVTRIKGRPSHINTETSSVSVSTLTSPSAAERARERETQRRIDLKESRYRRVLFTRLLQHLAAQPDSSLDRGRHKMSQEDLKCAVLDIVSEMLHGFKQHGGPLFTPTSPWAHHLYLGSLRDFTRKAPANIREYVLAHIALLEPRQSPKGTQEDATEEEEEEMFSREAVQELGHYLRGMVGKKQRQDQRHEQQEEQRIQER